MQVSQFLFSLNKIKRGIPHSIHGALVARVQGGRGVGAIRDVTIKRVRHLVAQHGELIQL